MTTPPHPNFNIIKGQRIGRQLSLMATEDDFAAMNVLFKKNKSIDAIILTSSTSSPGMRREIIRANHAYVTNPHSGNKKNNTVSNIYYMHKRCARWKLKHNLTYIEIYVVIIMLVFLSLVAYHMLIKTRNQSTQINTTTHRL